jgi:hypothetical protein
VDVNWKFSSDRLGLHLSLKTETETNTELVDGHPATSGRPRRSRQAVGGVAVLLLLWGAFAAHGLVSEVLLDLRGVDTTASVSKVTRLRSRTRSVAVVRFTDDQHRAGVGELHLPFRPPVGYLLRVVYDPDNTSRVQLADPGVPIVRLLAVATAVATAIGLLFRSAARRQAPVALQAAVFLAIWLGGMLAWELVVS